MPEIALCLLRKIKSDSIDKKNGGGLDQAVPNRLKIDNRLDFQAISDRPYDRRVQLQPLDLQADDSYPAKVLQVQEHPF